MLIQILVLLLNVAVGLLAGLCVLRAYLGWLRLPMGARSGNPIGPLILTVTDPLVLPLRRLWSWPSGVDVASLLVAYAAMCVKLLLLGLMGLASWTPLMLFWALFELLQLILSGLFGLVIVSVVLSWMQSYSPMAQLIDRLVTPLLSPIRRVVPLIGGLDLSPLVLILVLQVADMMLRSLRWSL